MMEQAVEPIFKTVRVIAAARRRDTWSVLMIMC